MIAKIVGASQEYEEEVRFLIDLNDYEAYNRSVATHNWRNSEGECVLTWFDTRYYPEDGIDAIYLPIDENTDIVFDFVDESSLLNEYIEKQNIDISYIEWLEKEILNLRKAK